MNIVAPPVGALLIMVLPLGAIFQSCIVVALAALSNKPIMGIEENSHHAAAGGAGTGD